MKLRTVLVTGASTGIGRSSALALVARGYRVFATVRRDGDADALTSACPAGHASRLEALLVDVTDHGQVRAGLDAVADATPEGLFALVNNAGFNLNGAFEFTSEADARVLMETNFFGLAALSREALPLLRRYATLNPGDTAKLINIGSIGSHIGVPWEAYYHASKFAVLGLSESMRHELWRERVRVVAVCPGGIKTDFMPKTSRSLAEARARLPDDAPDGYRSGLERLGRSVGLAARFGSAPEAVAERILRVLEKNNPRGQYLVGHDARLLLALKRFLPESLFHGFMRAQFTR